MEKITSFTIDHLKLLPGIYVSRKDMAGESVITTFDLRMTRPNFEPVMNTAEIHTIEHLGATFLRNHELFRDRVIYFGPWAAGLASTCFWPEITLPEILFLWCVTCSISYAILKVKYREPVPKTAVTIWT